MRKLSEINWNVALRILTYIKRSPCKGFLYKKYGHLLIEAFSYSNYAGDKRDKNLLLAIAFMLEVIW